MGRCCIVYTNGVVDLTHTTPTTGIAHTGCNQYIGLSGLALLSVYLTRLGHAYVS